jgi:hypothetical protein
MTDFIHKDQLRRYARPLRQVSPAIYQSAIRCGSYEKVYRLLYQHRDRISIPIHKPEQLTKGKNQMNFLATTSQSSLGHSHSSTLPRRKPVRVRKMVVGKISPKKYAEPIGPKEKHHYWSPPHMMCTVCGQNELTAWHDTDSPQDFHHRFVRDVKQLEFERQSKAQGMPVTVSSREDLRHLKAEGKI